MKLTDLAALVQVRNHILVVINDKSVTNRDEFSALNSLRIALDKKFVEGLKSLNTNNLFLNEMLLVKVGSENYKPSSQDLENWKAIFEQAECDPNFKIFTHNDVDITKVEISPDTKIKIIPNEKFPAIEVSPNISIKTKEQLPLPFSGISGVTGPIETGAFGGMRAGTTGLASMGVKPTEGSTGPIGITGPIEPSKERPRKGEPTGPGPVEPPKFGPDPEFLEALKREKVNLAKQGRSNKKVPK